MSAPGADQFLPPPCTRAGWKKRNGKQLTGCLSRMEDEEINTTSLLPPPPYTSYGAFVHRPSRAEAETQAGSEAMVETSRRLFGRRLQPAQVLPERTPEPNEHPGQRRQIYRGVSSSMKRLMSSPKTV